MANFCQFELMAKGPEKDLKSLVSLFKTTYPHPTIKDATEDHPEGDHLAGVFYAGISGSPADGEIIITGDCQWSVFSSMISGGDNFKADDKNNPACKEKPLDVWAKEHPEVFIEITGYEGIQEFAERYVFSEGINSVNEEEPLISMYIYTEEDLHNVINQEEEDNECLKKLKELKSSIESGEEVLFPVHLDIKHPKWLTPNEDFEETGEYSAVFSI